MLNLKDLPSDNITV